MPTGLKSPFLWAPVLGIILMPVGHHLPKEITNGLETIASAVSGVAVFTVGRVLAADSFHLSTVIFFAMLGRSILPVAGYHRKRHAAAFSLRKRPIDTGAHTTPTGKMLYPSEKEGDLTRSLRGHTLT